MVWAGVYLTGLEWLWPAVGFLVVAAMLLLWGYRGAGVPTPWKAGCIALKLAGLTTLALCLLDPLWVGQRAKPGANLFLVLADNSQSLQITDPSSGRSRGEEVGSWLAAGKSGWLAQLEDHFEVRRFWFDGRLQSVRDFAELHFGGRATALHGALRGLGERYRGRPVAGILLFTDGNATDLPAENFDLSGHPPLYPVVLGGEGVPRDIALHKVHVSQTGFEDAPVTIQADILAQGFAGATLVAQLRRVGTNGSVPVPSSRSDLSSDSPAVQPAPPGVVPKTMTPLAELRQKVVRSSDQVSFRFQFRPESSGVSFYQVRVASLADMEQSGGRMVSSEATLQNNARLVVVDRGQGPHRILYVSGRPNWEFKFLNRALAEDVQVQLVGLIRVARREPKFEFKGRQGEMSNPLFRGFDRKTEETERYDQPVLIRLNTRDGLELSGGFPKSAEELFAYAAVILDDLEASFFTRDQMLLLQRFVAERGGGLLMLGGADSFQDGQYARTPVGDVMPLYLDQVSLRPAPQGLRLALTPDGWLQPWTRLRNNESGERERLDAMPPLQVLNPARSVKPGAMVLATVADPAGQAHPALVAQRFGRGKSLALLVGDFWRWGLHEETMQRDLARAWRQMIRWLVVDVPPFVGLEAQPKTEGLLLPSIALQTRAREKDFRPLDNARVTVRVQPIPVGADLEAMRTNTVQFLAEPSATEAGLYEAVHLPREAGGYLAEAVVVDNGGAEVGRAQAGWTSDPAAEEFSSLRPNRGLLEQLARKTGGRVLEFSELDAWGRSLPSRPAPITETWSLPLWHRAAVFLFALACFAAEWGLRRFRGLA